MNIKELAEKIEKKAGVDVMALPIGRRFMTRGPDGAMAAFDVEGPWPIKNPVKTMDGKTEMQFDGSTIMAIFQGDDEVRVYTLFLGESKNPPPPSRYTISKHQPAIFSEVMAIETFINELADEWSTVDEGISTAERERAAVVAYLQANMSKSGYVLAIEIAEGKHLPDDDEEDDDEPEGVVPSVPAASPS